MEDRFRQVEVSGFQGTVVPGEISEKAWWNTTGRVPSGSWDPTDAELETFETKLPTALAGDEDERSAEVLENLATYTRQYLGVVEEGRRLMEVRFLCQRYIDRRDFDWRTTLVGVDGGGDCFFEARYDADQEAIFLVSIHGES